jgi:hypothetical protein
MYYLKTDSFSRNFNLNAKSDSLFPLFSNEEEVRVFFNVFLLDDHRILRDFNYKKLSPSKVKDPVIDDFTPETKQ